MRDRAYTCALSLAHILLALKFNAALFSEEVESQSTPPHLVMSNGCRRPPPAPKRWHRNSGSGIFSSATVAEWDQVKFDGRWTVDKSMRASADATRQPYLCGRVDPLWLCGEWESFEDIVDALSTQRSTLGRVTSRRLQTGGVTNIAKGG